MSIINTTVKAVWWWMWTLALTFCIYFSKQVNMSALLLMVCCCLLHSNGLSCSHLILLMFLSLCSICTSAYVCLHVFRAGVKKKNESLNMCYLYTYIILVAWHHVDYRSSRSCWTECRWAAWYEHMNTVIWSLDLCAIDELPLMN